MADQGMASIQFSSASTPPSYGSPEHRQGVEIGQEQQHESPVSLSSNYMTSADAVTAWRVRRSGKPLPYSKRTAGSLYRWDQD